MRSCLGGAAAAAAAAALVLGAPVGAFHIAARPSIIGKVQYRSASSRSPLQLASASSALALSDDNNDISASSTGLAIPRWQRFSRQFRTLLRVGFPSAVAGVAATLVFPALTRLACTVNSAQTFALLTPAATDYTGQFLSVIGLLYSLLVGQTYSFVYSQQEAIYYALFNEVTEAKSL